ncbi:ricin-type beta-trefoil lectin domain protein [Streptomyces sp. NPDC020192]|uniref:ricin-type beta-trefoil lectin domain protein n=1 Tax=Streptomyces sp. NPDC020192 TaxID=3365066 RepID=UPI00378B6E5E
MLAGVALTSLALLATVLVVRSWSDDNSVPMPGATWGAPVGHTARPSGTRTSPSAASVGSGGSVGDPGDPLEVAHGSLRELASGRCLDVRGGRVEAGAGMRLAPCSSGVSQQWSYQDDGLLRSAADPSLCLAADPGTKSVVLAGCLVHEGEVAYDITVRGEILLRWHEGLALAAAAGAGGVADGVGLAQRDGAAGERWVLEPGGGAGASGRGDGAPDAAGSPGAPDGPGVGQPGRAKGEDGEGGGPGLPEMPDTQGQLGPSGPPEPSVRSGDANEPRIAQVRADHDQGGTGSGSPGGALPAVGDVLPQVTGGITAAHTAVGTLLG